MYSDAVPVHVRQCLERLDSDHLVSHLGLSAVFVNRLLELRTAVLRAPVVLHIDNVSALGHIHFPHPHLAEPCVRNHLGMRTSIYVENHRIFLGRVESHRLVEPEPVVVFPVGALHRSEGHLAGGIFCKRIRA